MALSIRNRDVEEKARRYAALHNMSVTAAIGKALDQRLAEEGAEREQRMADFLKLVKDIQARVAALPILDPRPIDEILYDEDGLPH